MEMRGCFSAGKMWAVRAASGRLCWGSNAMCVEEIMSPFGNVIGMGFDVFLLL